MNEFPILDSEFAASVMAVPPLARRADYALDIVENRALIRHIEAGGVRTLLHAVKTGDKDTAQRPYDAFLSLETLRDEISLIRVLHDAVTFSTIADMGPILPLLSSTPPEHHAKIGHATQTLLALERQFAQQPAWR